MTIIIARQSLTIEIKTKKGSGNRKQIAPDKRSTRAF